MVSLGHRFDQSAFLKVRCTTLHYVIPSAPELIIRFQFLSSRAFFGRDRFVRIYHRTQWASELIIGQFQSYQACFVSSLECTKCMCSGALFGRVLFMRGCSTILGIIR